MPKYNKPVMGYRIEDVLNDEPAKMEEETSRNIADMIEQLSGHAQGLINIKIKCMKDAALKFNETVERVSPGINTGICCHKRQAGVIHDRLKTLSAANTKREERRNQLNRQEKALEASEVSDGIDLSLESFRSFVHSIHLACYNCLNAGCLSRDPNYPFEEVQERAKQFEEAEKTKK